MKELFHTAKIQLLTNEPPENRHLLELEMILRGFSTVQQRGESPIALEEFQTFCTKLAQTHFMPQLDRYYTIVPQIIREIVDRVRTEPSTKSALLLGATPYVLRLRIQDAHRFYTLCAQEEFLNSSSTYKSIFIHALRRAAQLMGDSRASNPKVVKALSRKEEEDFLALTPRYPTDGSTHVSYPPSQASSAEKERSASRKRTSSNPRFVQNHDSVRKVLKLTPERVSDLDQTKETITQTAPSEALKKYSSNIITPSLSTIPSTHSDPPGQGREQNIEEGRCMTEDQTPLHPQPLVHRDTGNKVLISNPDPTKTTLEREMMEDNSESFVDSQLWPH